MDTLSLSLNGRVTGVAKPAAVVRNKLVHAMTAGSVTENSATNSWNINFSSGNLNNNNKNNSNSVRAVCALGEKEAVGWIDAFHDCIRNKLTTSQCNEYRAVYEEDLVKLMNEVHNRIYEPTISTCFIVTRPRLREIFAASFRDRIVQHWITIRLLPILENYFVEVGDISFNCRKGYGSLRAVWRFCDAVRKYQDAWVAKFDIKSFFMSINKEILLSKLIPFIKERYKGDDMETLIYLVEKTIRHNPQNLCRRKSPLCMWNDLPKHKSLFYAEENIGIAIGNITSQILANFYLGEVDRWLVAECKNNNAEAVRFVDDIAVVSTDKQFLINLHKRLSAKLAEVGLTLHSNKFYLQHASKGVKFVGQVIKPSRCYTSNSTVDGFYKCFNSLEKLCERIVTKKPTLYMIKRLKHLVDGINSYLGFLCHASSYGIRRKVIMSGVFFWRVCYVKSHFLVVKIKYNYKLNNFLQ